MLSDQCDFHKFKNTWLHLDRKLNLQILFHGRFIGEKFYAKF